MAKKKLKRVGVMSVATTMALIGVVWGLIYGIIILAVGASFLGSLGAGFGGIVVIVGIIGGAIGGFIGGAVGALIYNAAAHFTGGYELELETRSSEGLSL